MAQWAFSIMPSQGGPLIAGFTVLLSTSLCYQEAQVMTVVANMKTTEVLFILTGHPDAKQVYLTGDFNQWDPKKHRMSKYRDGSFRARLSLVPGTYQYKFVADGIWLNDPESQAQAKNGFGTVNSLVRVG
jgi:1,4-alpha-glucan branching enzyme